MFSDLSPSFREGPCSESPGKEQGMYRDSFANSLKQGPWAKVRAFTT